MMMTVNTNSRGAISRSVLIALVCVVIVAGLVFAGFHFFGSNSQGSAHMNPSEARDAVASYLKKKSRTRDFQTEFDYAQDKRPWETLPKQYDTASDYDTVYRLIGKHLYVADKLIKSSDSKEERAGKRLLLEIMEAAHDIAVDDWLACRICDGYVVPLIQAEEKASDDAEQMYHRAARYYSAADELDSEYEFARLYIQKAAGTGRRSDWIRYRVVRALEMSGRRDEADDLKKQLATLASASTNSTRKLDKPQVGSTNSGSTNITRKVDRIRSTNNVAALKRSTNYTGTPRRSTNTTNSVKRSTNTTATATP
jgi:hypothetical protein